MTILLLEFVCGKISLKTRDSVIFILFLTTDFCTKSGQEERHQPCSYLLSNNFMKRSKWAMLKAFWCNGNFQRKIQIN